MKIGEFIQAYGISSNTQLANFAKGVDLPLIEINFAEGITISQEGAYIINLGSKQKGGTHWTGLWIEGDSAFYFDSYGVGPEDILVDKIQSYNPNIIVAYNNGFEFQRFEEELCGMWVLMFFHFMTINKGLSLEQRFKKMTERYLDVV